MGAVLEKNSVSWDVVAAIACPILLAVGGYFFRDLYEWQRTHIGLDYHAGAPALVKDEVNKAIIARIEGLAKIQQEVAVLSSSVDGISKRVEKLDGQLQTASESLTRLEYVSKQLLTDYGRVAPAAHTHDTSVTMLPAR